VWRGKTIDRSFRLRDVVRVLSFWFGLILMQIFAGLGWFRSRATAIRACRCPRGCIIWCCCRSFGVVTRADLASRASMLDSDDHIRTAREGPVGSCVILHHALANALILSLPCSTHICF
jgi:ABC-type dipeptide/oligopeptide/nickel transport system permease component